MAQRNMTATMAPTHRRMRATKTADGPACCLHRAQTSSPQAPEIMRKRRRRRLSPRGTSPPSQPQPQTPGP